jgi:plasmid replication initiation protein
MSELTVVKSNHVIEAGYRLTLNEQRLILLCIQQIKKGQVVSKHDAFNINAVEFANTFDITTDRAYVLLQEIADKLYERSLLIYQPDPDEPKLSHTKTRWISAIDYIPDDGRLKLYFAPKVIPYISLLESGFTRYNLEYVANMSSIYGLRFYELFKCWLMGDKSKIKIISIDELKTLLDLKDEKGGYQYPSIKDFKLKVLDKGLNDVNQHTDLKAAYETKKTGRRITDLEFTVKLKGDVKPKIEPNQPTLEAKPSTQTKVEPINSDKGSKAELEHLKRLAALGGVPLETLLKPAKKA